MNVSYKGIKQELSPKIQKKMDVKFGKLSKLLERRGEKEAHVVVTSERHLSKVEITIQYYGQQLVGEGSDPDLLNALSQACEKLETQAVKNRGRWREKKRRAETGAPATESAPKAAAAKGKGVKSPAKSGNGAAQRIYKVNHRDDRKPMTLDEAVMEMEQNQDYLVYRDADKDRVSVLVRRRDGHFDLIEG
jgi:putative sigma-54 modulation protein